MLIFIIYGIFYIIHIVMLKIDLIINIYKSKGILCQHHFKDTLCSKYGHETMITEKHFFVWSFKWELL